MVDANKTREMTMNANPVALMGRAGVVAGGASDAWAQNRSGGSGYSSWSGCSGALTYSPPSTYKVGSTTYKSGSTTRRIPQSAAQQRGPQRVPEPAGLFQHAGATRWTMSCPCRAAGRMPPATCSSCRLRCIGLKPPKNGLGR
jgi:hypothetical protein